MSIATFETSNLADELLLDVARQIQLPPSDYRLAEQHYHALHRHLARDDSPLRGLVAKLYAQGGMAIGAVVSSKFDTDEFDLDAIVELAISPRTQPGLVLDTLYQAVNGERGSLYHGKVKRRTRCVMVDYDRMHVDLTPSVALPGQAPRVSHIFHAHEHEPQHLHKHVLANPWGFAEWFEQQMPAASFFAESVLRKAALPLPDPEELEQKSLPLIALQLTKRWRNKCYDQRDVRRPPSVMLAYFCALVAGTRPSLLTELMAQAQHLLRVFEDHDRRGALIIVRNPTCAGDVFSDRWPGSLAEQRRFTGDLRSLVASLNKLAAAPSFEECSTIMAGLFGERPVQSATKAFVERYSGSAYGNRLRQHLGSGAIALGASGIGRVAKSASATFSAPPSTHYGSDDGGRD